MDDIRNHDSRPSPEEAEWIADSAVTLVVRAVALAAVALSVGWGASAFLDQAAAKAPMVAESAR